MSKVFFIIMTAATSLLFCETEKLGEEIRISPSEVHVSEQGIFIFLDEQWVPVELSRNSKGISIRPRYQKINWGLFWECQCGELNSSLAKTCQNCGEGRYDYPR